MEHQDHQGHKEHQEELLRADKVARHIVDAGLKIHRALGPGLLESAYEACLAREFELRHLRFSRQETLPVVYEGLQLESGYRLDIVVEKSVIIEVKAVEQLNRLHTAQLLTYLRLSSYRIGLLMNFNVTLFKNGIRRFVT